MKIIAIIGLAACVAGSAAAQTTLPPGIEKNGYGGSGTGFCQLVGENGESHIQIVNGDLQGSGTLRTWNSLSFRRANTLALPTGVSNTTRTWSNFTLSLGDADYSKASKTFSTNFVSPPTQVYSGRVTFPTVSGSKYNPAWGNFAASNDMKFPFSSPYYSTGTWGTTVDMRFTGGGAASMPYYIDGLKNAQGTEYNEAVAYWYGKAGSCFATGQAANGYVDVIARSHGPNYKDPNSGSTANADQITIHFNGVNLAKNSPAVVFLQTGGWRGHNQTSPIPLCQGLSIRLNQPYWIGFFRTSANGTWDNKANPWRFKYDVSYVNTRLWTQAAYENAGRKVDVSMAISHWVSVQPPLAKHLCFYNFDANAGAPTGIEVKKDLPIVRLDK